MWTGATSLYRCEQALPSFVLIRLETTVFKTKLEITCQMHLSWYLFLVAVGIQSRALHVLGKHCAIQLSPWPLHFSIPLLLFVFHSLF